MSPDESCEQSCLWGKSEQSCLREKSLIANNNPLVIAKAKIQEVCVNKLVTGKKSSNPLQYPCSSQVKKKEAYE